MHKNYQVICCCRNTAQLCLTLAFRCACLCYACLFGPLFCVFAQGNSLTVAHRHELPDNISKYAHLPVSPADGQCPSCRASQRSIQAFYASCELSPCTGNATHRGNVAVCVAALSVRCCCACYSFWPAIQSATRATLDHCTLLLSLQLLLYQYKHGVCLVEVHACMCLCMRGCILCIVCKDVVCMHIRRCAMACDVIVYVG